ncbi:MAG: TerB family tellurite resistance protein [Deltaproteobacteria bacterium]|jgi:uncharacterized tellurite resistance protein B-like protein|nr:TerB family tellurite resistance protein [Deltaproteobacteria bacterium]
MSSIFIKKDNLLSMVFCALLMSAIDKEIHKLEWDIIQKFVRQYWQKDWGDFGHYKKQMISELKQIVADQEQTTNKLESVLSDLKSRLDQPQKNKLLKLAGEVMAADNVMSPEESDLFAIFLNNLGIQSQAE